MGDDIEHELLSEAENAWAQHEWTIQHVLFPSMKLFLNPPTSMATNGTFVQVINSFPWTIQTCSQYDVLSILYIKY